MLVPDVELAREPVELGARPLFGGLENEGPRVRLEGLRAVAAALLVQRGDLPIHVTEQAEIQPLTSTRIKNEMEGTSTIIYLIPEGTVVESTKGAEYVVLRPTLEDFVLEMPRGAQVIYPKDLAPILMLADIAPGVRVFESGLGSGALSTAMLRAGAEVTGYEVREDFANRARINVRSFLGEGALERYHVSVADSYAGIDESLGPFDRVVLDLPEPWQVVPHAERVLRHHLEGLGGGDVEVGDHQVSPAVAVEIVDLELREEALGADDLVGGVGPGGAGPGEEQMAIHLRSLR